MSKKSYNELRSSRWFSDIGKAGYIHRERIAQAGFSRSDYEGKPVIGIFSTWSELNPCHIHFRERAEDVKRGVWSAGGFPVEVPCMSLGEPYMKPTTMLYRDLLAMEVEENILAHPIDGVVLMGGCDKTTPAMLMGAFAQDIPCIYLPAGPMLTGRWRGHALGSGTDASRWFNELHAGRITKAEFDEMETAGARSPGTCQTMGTASTMTLLAEVMGLSLPGAASIPAPDSRHRHMATECGKTIVDMTWNDRKPSTFIIRSSFENAIRVLNALGGSTNAPIHLIAMAQRLGFKFKLDDFDESLSQLPVLANIKPSGQYLMEDFYYAGGLPALMTRIKDNLDLTTENVRCETLRQTIENAHVYDDDVIRPIDKPVSDKGGLAVFKGNLAPSGCVIKLSAASQKLLRHEGRAIVFGDRQDAFSRINDPALNIQPEDILILRYCGPKGRGLPEWGMLPIPDTLLKKGVRDMVRITDARMSGTHFGTVFLHVSPEAAVGGALALVQDGDRIEIDADKKEINLLISDTELEIRKAAWKPVDPAPESHYRELYRSRVNQAHEGAILDTCAHPNNNNFRDNACE